MHNTGLEIPEELRDEIDRRRPSTLARGQWIRDACRARLLLEDEGVWRDDPDDLEAEIQRLKRASDADDIDPEEVSSRA